MNDANLLRLMKEVLHKEYKIYEQIFDLSQCQLALLDEINNPDVNEIADLMNRKIELVGDIQEMEIHHAPIKRQWGEQHEQYSQEERDGVAQLRNRSMNLIERLHGMEKNIAQGIERCKSDINRRLGGIKRGRNVTQAYFSYERLPPRYIDKKK